jgi:hypothetical protein
MLGTSEHALNTPLCPIVSLQYCIACSSVIVTFSASVDTYKANRWEVHYAHKPFSLNQTENQSLRQIYRWSRIIVHDAQISFDTCGFGLYYLFFLNILSFWNTFVIGRKNSLKIPKG